MLLPKLYFKQFSVNMLSFKRFMKYFVNFMNVTVMQQFSFEYKSLYLFFKLYHLILLNILFKNNVISFRGLIELASQED